MTDALVLTTTQPREASAGIATFSIVVPTFNEVDNVGLLVEKIQAIFPRDAWELVFVDDDSTDGTLGTLRELCRTYPNVRMIRRIGRRGLSSAVVEGILSTAAPYVAVMDADLQHDEKLLPRMLQLLRSDEAELVIGSRYVDGGGTGNWDQSRLRKSRIATHLSKLILKAESTDPMSGFFMLKRSTFDAAVKSLSGQGFKILLDIMASSPVEPRVRELPYTFGLRQHGESKLDALVALEYINLILDKYFGRWVPSRFIIFAAVGGLGVFVHMAVLSLTHINGVPFVYGQSVATLTAMTFNFFLNNFLTYRDRRLKGARQLALGLLSFYAICSLGVVANIGVANVLFEHDYTWWLSALGGIVIGVVWNYAATSIFTWRR